MARDVGGTPGEPGPGEERALRGQRSMRANPAERSREMRLTCAHRTREPKWKRTGVRNGW